MVNTELLDKYIAKSGYRIDYLANYIGVSNKAFNRKRTNKQSFMSSEVDKLRYILKITSNATEVFFLS